MNDPEDPADFEYQWGHWNLGSLLDQGSTGNAELHAQLMPIMAKGSLLAWDPVKQAPAWEVPQFMAWGGGVLATAGNLVLQGNPSREFAAYRADNGDKLWQFDAQVGVIGSPVTYRVDGEQYIAVPAGWGGIIGLSQPLGNGQRPEKSRILAFKLGANGELPPMPPIPPREPPPARISTDPELLEQGRVLYTKYCIGCHGAEVISGGTVPDLRRLPNVFYDNFDAIVLDGAMAKMGMVGFSDVLSKDDSYAIKAYVLDAANDDWEVQQQPQWWRSIKTAFYQVLAQIIGWLAQLQAT
jgi:quinohemoprotein ethanol dehydrogenase